MNIKPHLFATALLLSIASYTSASAQEDETDLSRYKVVEDEGKLPTLAEFKIMEDDVISLHENGQCNDLIIKAPEAADAANRLANVIGQGLKPFYDAGSDERGVVRRRLGEDFDLLIEAESAANNLRLIRNKFWVYEASCLIEMGNRGDGINKLYRALDSIDAYRQEDLWAEAREALWSTIDYN